MTAGSRSAFDVTGSLTESLPSGRPILLDRADAIVSGDLCGGAVTTHVVRLHDHAIKTTAGEFASAVADAARSARTIVAWSGTLADEPFGDDPRTWLAGGQAAFAEFCSHATATLSRLGAHLLLQPHARHVLSDVPSTRSALRTLDGQPFGLALSPASLLTTSMLDRIDDHLTRIFEGLGPIADVLILDDVARSSSAQANAAHTAESGADETADPLPKACPLGTGALPRAHVLALIEAHVPTNVPIVIGAASARDPIAAREWIAG